MRLWFEKVDAGMYKDASEVLHQALQALEERDQLNRLRAALAVAEEQIERGEVVRWTPELREEIRREARDMARRGLEPHPDVCP
jgi:putative addiction module CopG family antidote